MQCKTVKTQNTVQLHYSMSPGHHSCLCCNETPDERPPWSESILMRVHPDERPPWWEFTMMKDHPDGAGYVGFLLGLAWLVMLDFCWDWHGWLCGTSVGIGNAGYVGLLSGLVRLVMCDFCWDGYGWLHGTSRDWYGWLCGTSVGIG